MSRLAKLFDKKLMLFVHCLKSNRNLDGKIMSTFFAGLIGTQISSRSSVLRTIAMTLCLLTPIYSQAWGGTGHHVIGAIADIQLRGTNAEKHVQALLKQMDPATETPVSSDCRVNADNCTLAKYAVWADCEKGPFYCPKENDTQTWLDAEMRAFDKKFGLDAHAFHYTDIPLQESKYFETSVGSNPNDIVHILRECIDVLKNGSKATNPHRFTQRQALLLIAHLVGDIHQPLHVGALYVDQHDGFVNANGSQNVEATHGGNYVMLGSANLHHFWDSTTVDAVMKSMVPISGTRDPATLAVALLNSTKQLEWQTKGDVLTWSQKWADESLHLATLAYANIELDTRESVWDPDKQVNHLQWKIKNEKNYDQAWAKSTTQNQMTIAGKRLAELLKVIWP
jgi:hypothetical protein